LVEDLAKRGPLYVILHDWKSDVEYLRKLRVSTDRFKFIMPNAPPEDGIFCVDTAILFSALEGHKEPKSLTRMCRILGMTKAERFHNAGNDARYTFDAFVGMASGLPVDAQRDQRWPPNPSETFPNSKKTYAREPREEDESDFDESLW